MVEMTPTAAMVDAARNAKLGELLVVYRDGTNIRAETDNGKDPFVWRGGRWQPMAFPTKPQR